MGSKTSVRATDAQLRAVARAIKERQKGSSLYERRLLMAYIVLRHFLGDDWGDRHLCGKPDADPFLFFDPNNDEENSKTGRLQIVAGRVLELVNMLISLQSIEGFDHVVDRLRTSGVEPTFAELQSALQLFVSRTKFKFTVPQGQKGRDYDLEITLRQPERIICADTKRKIESTTVSEESALGSLNEARKQLPPDRPGAIFLSVPNKWMNEQVSETPIGKATKRFFVGTGRVVLTCSPICPRS